jgi:hydroxyethylthiazole kinase-like uncharacterized protein yjeF
VVLCGPGNNGGDGFVVARLLKEWGWEVEVFLYGDPERLPPDARANYERWRGMGEVKASTSFDPWTHRDLFVDAIFGTGLTRKLDAEVLRLVSQLGGERVVAVDCPSGYCLDSGRALLDGDELDSAADLTVTFQFMKIGHILGNGPLAMGDVRVVEIGLNERAALVELRAIHDVRTGLKRDPSAVVSQIDREIFEAASHTQTGAPLSKFAVDHKYSHGHALILSGPSGRGGAARLAARGALRIGAGVVTVGCPPDAIPENSARLDAVMLRGVVDGLALEEALADPRINALCVGPGLGLDARGRELVAVALESRGRPRATGADVGDVGRGLPRRSMVLDADALTILSQTPDLFAALHEGCVLTPHAGEFARLFPDIAEKLAAPATKGPAYSKVDATRKAAKRSGCVVLFKGPDTVIADPSGQCAINSAHYDRAAPWLATAGSGDVLAGFITGLLARGFSPFDAACTGAWLHVECALSFGPGLIAEDLPEELPKVFRALGL